MAYWDGLVNASFKTRGTGQSVFFPYGKFSYGFVLSKDAELRVKKFLKNYYKISSPVAIIAVLAVGLYAFFLLLIFLPWYVVEVRSIVKNQEIASERFETSDSMRTMALSMGFRTCALLLLGGVLLLATCIVVLFKTDHRILGLAGALFFGLGSIRILQLLLLTWPIKEK